MTIAIDTETTLASNDEPIPRLVSVAISDGERTSLTHHTDSGLFRMLRQRLEGQLAFANAPFDIYVLGRKFPELWPDMIRAYEEGRIHDVLTREKYIDFASGHQRGRYNLGAVAERRCNMVVDKDDPWRLRYEELIDVPVRRWPGEAIHYALHDARATHRIWEAQEAFRREHAHDVFQDAPNTARAHLALYQQTLIGIDTDQAQVDRVDRFLEEEINRHAAILLYHGLARIQGKPGNKTHKITRCQDKARALMASLPGPKMYTDTGLVSMSEEALQRAHIPEGHPLDAYRRLGSLKATRTKNIPILRRPRIRTRYDELKVTGRTGSSGPQGKRSPAKVEPWEWIGTNLQNQPTKGGFRECLVPPPDHVFLISDWSGAELVALAQVQLDLFGTSRLAEVLQAGGSPHKEVAAKLLNCTPDEVDKDRPEYRIAKEFNFGKAGGMGNRRFASVLAKRGIERTERQVAADDRLWKQTWPEMQRMFDYVANLQNSEGKATIIQPRSGFVCGGRTFSEACNLLFQGLAASAAKTALWDLWLAGKDPNSPLLGCYQVLFVHDENVTVAPIDRAETALAEQERIMVDAFRKWCPDVPISVDSQITERYTK